MASTSLYNLSYNPFSSTPSRKKFDCRKRAIRTRILASGKEPHDQNYYGGRMVDEDMIVLRKRIHEMKIVEGNYDPPSDWMEWEKRYFTSYDSLICGMVGVLQSQLMETRPSLALGFVALVTLSVPMSIAMVLYHFMEMSKMVLAGIHLP